MGQIVKKRKESKVSDSVLIKRILNRNLTRSDLVKEFEIPEASIRKYEKSNTGRRNRLTELRTKLEAIDHTLTKAANLGLPSNIETIKKLQFQGSSLIWIIKAYSKSGSELVTKIIDEVIEKELKLEVQRKSAVTSFREQYNYLNEETISIASKENPKLLIELLDDDSLQPSTRASILEAIAIGAREDYFNLVRSKLKDSSPHLREAAVISLLEYYNQDHVKYGSLVNEIEEYMKAESAAGVKLTFKEILEQMVA